MSGTEPGTSAASPRVSIVTPARLAASLLPETYASVRGQTFTDWEWVLVDDASDDGTRELAEQWAQRDARVRTLQRSRSDGLAASARNVGLAAARGELIALLDADDLWHEEKLEIQVRYLDEHPEAGGVCTWYETFGYEPWARADHRIHPPETVVRREHFLRGSGVRTSTLVFRRSTYEQVGGFDVDPRLVTGEDEEYYFRLTLAAGIHRVARVLTYVRLRPPGLSVTGRPPGDRSVKKLHLATIYLEKGLIEPEEASIVRSNAYYQQAGDNLFKYRAPFRGHLVRSVLEGRPPAPAILMLALGWLPAPLLRPLLASLQGLRRRFKLRRSGGSEVGSR